MSMDAPPTSPVLPDKRPIDADLPCWKCGYSLRTAEPDRACPECGEPIQRTFAYLLAVQPAIWLNQLMLAAILLVLTVCVAVASVSIGMFVLSAMAPALGQTMPINVGGQAMWELITWSPHILFVIALFILPIANPALPNDPTRPAQLRLRMLALAVAACFILNAVVLPLSLGTGALLSLLVTALEFAAFVVALFVITGLLRRAQRPRAASVGTGLVFSGIALMFATIFVMLTPAIWPQSTPATPYAVANASATLGSPADYFIVHSGGSLLRLAAIPPGVPPQQPSTTWSNIAATTGVICLPVGLVWIALATGTFIVAAAAFRSARRLGERLRHLSPPT